MRRHPRGLFGRDRELAEAEESLDAAASGDPQLLLVGGDAGIGKTALAASVTELASRRGFTVATGHCLDIDLGIAWQPVRDALRQALGGRGEEDLPPVTRRMAAFLRGDAAAATVDDLGLVVRELTEEAPVLLVLEDMHWSDRSTQVLAVSLAHTARGPLCLLLTFRTDELTRRHPFRRTLVELGRGSGAHRLELGALDREALGGIVEAATGRRDEALVGSLLARSEGNPLYAEELLADGPDQLPATLSALLLGRIDTLTPSTRELMRLASVHGSRVDSALLAEVAGLTAEGLDDCLREATDANVLRSNAEHLDFRHGLLREAVYDDLLPSERARAHAGWARSLQRRVDSRPPPPAELAALAFHWYAAHDIAEAFAAAVRAGLAAHQRGGSEGIALLERALELYDQVPHDRPDEVAKADLLRALAVTLSRNAQVERSDQMIREALDLVRDDADPWLTSRVCTTYASMCDEIEDWSHRPAAPRKVRPRESFTTLLERAARRRTAPRPGPSVATPAPAH